MSWIVVAADVVESNRSEQFTTVLFQLTESIDNVETTGEAPGAEFFMKVNITESTVIGIIRFLALPTVINTSLITFTLTRKIFHFIPASTDAVHVS